MEGAKSGMTGATPELKVNPVDPNIPQCPKTVVTSAGPQQCTRKQGHYGPCGVADAES